MTFSHFAKMLKSLAGGTLTNGGFVLALIDESLEDVSDADRQRVLKDNGCESYNPIKSEGTARKYFDGDRRITRKNFETIGQHFERNKFLRFLKDKVLRNDDNYRHLVLRLKEYGVDCTEDSVEDMCADVFEAIIIGADSEYVSPVEKVKIADSEQKKFLEFSYTVFQRIVKEENWPFKSPKYRIFKHKTYTLTDEGIDARFDIAIENYNGENDTPSQKLLVKCQRLNRPVTKDELVLFFSRVRQVAGCCKALFVTNSFCGPEVLSYAIRMGVGILRIFDEKKNKMACAKNDGRNNNIRRG